MKIKSKIVALALTLIGCVALTSVGYSIYTINGSSPSKEIEIPVKPIETQEAKKLYSFAEGAGSIKNIKYEENHNLIVDDTMEIIIKYNAGILNDLETEESYYDSGLLINLVVPNSDLYNHLKNHICFYQDFLTIKIGSKSYSCESGKSYRYYANSSLKDNELPYFVSNDSNKSFDIHIPTFSDNEVVKQGFAIQSIFSDYSNVDMSIILNFHLMEEKINDKITKTNFDNMKINISMEMYK